MYVCLCRRLTASQVQKAAEGTETLEGLLTALGLRDDDCCGRCAAECEGLLLRAKRGLAPLSAPPCEAAPLPILTGSGAAYLDF